MAASTSEPRQAWREQYPFESHYTSVQGVRLPTPNSELRTSISELRLHYVDEGQGAPVVMVHGNPTWSFYYRRLAGALRSERRVIVPDHIGCGLSDKPQDYSYTLQQHVDNLEHLLENELTLKEPMVLVVHDWGGAIGMGYAVRHPEKIAGCVILNTAAFLLPNCPWRIWICKCPGFGALAIRGLNAFAGAAVTMATTQPGGLPEPVRSGFIAPYDSWANRIATLRFVQDIPLNPAHPTWKTIEGIQENLQLLADKPKLICWGERDFCFSEPFLKKWLEYFPDARTHRFPDAGHYVLEDAFDEILPLVRGLLERTGPATGRAESAQ